MLEDASTPELRERLDDYVRGHQHPSVMERLEGYVRGHQHSSVRREPRWLC